MSSPVVPTTTTRKRRLTLPERRPLVKLYLQTEGWGPTDIMKKINEEKNSNVSRQVVADDINVLTAENDMWSHNQAMTGWLVTVRERHKSLLTEIAYLERKLSTHRTVERFENLDDALLTKAQHAFLLENQNAILKLPEYLAIQKTLAYTTAMLNDLIERNVLYRKTAEYAKFYQEQSARENS